LVPTVRWAAVLASGALAGIGGTEASITPLGVAGFASMRSSATVSATGGGGPNIALCIGCNVLEINVNMQVVDDATTGGADASGGDQTTTAADQAGAGADAQRRG